MKNKNGFLLAEQTIKIIIALIAIVLLVFLLVNLYYSRVRAENQAAAINSLTGQNKIEDYIQVVNQGINVEPLEILRPKSWYLFSFTRDIRPNSCVGQNCLCICDNVGSFHLIKSFYTDEIERQIEECDANGACLVVENLIDRELEIEIPVNISIKKQDNNIVIS